MTELAPPIDAVTARLARVERLEFNSSEDWKRWHADGDRVVQELRDEFSARIRLDREPATMRMGGVSTSATGGWAALLRNWVAAARKKLVAS